MTNSETNVAAQAGDEPRLDALMAEWFGTEFTGLFNPDRIKAYSRALLAAQVPPRATADVERNLRAELINEGALRQYCHNDGSAGFVTAYDFDVTNRFLAAIATTKPGA